MENRKLILLLGLTPKEVVFQGTLWHELIDEEQVSLLRAISQQPDNVRMG